MKKFKVPGWFMLVILFSFLSACLLFSMSRQPFVSSFERIAVNPTDRNLKAVPIHNTGRETENSNIPTAFDGTISSFEFTARLKAERKERSSLQGFILLSVLFIGFGLFYVQKIHDKQYEKAWQRWNFHEYLLLLTIYIHKRDGKKHSMPICEAPQSNLWHL